MYYASNITPDYDDIYTQPIGYANYQIDGKHVPLYRDIYGNCYTRDEQNNTTSVYVGDYYLTKQDYDNHGPTRQC